MRQGRNDKRGSTPSQFDSKMSPNSRVSAVLPCTWSPTTASDGTKAKHFRVINDAGAAPCVAAPMNRVAAHASSVAKRASAPQRTWFGVRLFSVVDNCCSSVRVLSSGQYLPIHLRRPLALALITLAPNVFPESLRLLHIEDSRRHRHTFRPRVIRFCPPTLIQKPPRPTTGFRCSWWR